jgi:hypothetical protein
MFVTVPDGKIQRSPVHAGLSSGNDFHPAAPATRAMLSSIHEAKMKRPNICRNGKVRPRSSENGLINSLWQGRAAEIVLILSEGRALQAPVQQNA